MIDVIREAFRLVGYRNEYAQLNAANYGVPQTRRRIFIMGTASEKPLEFPFPTNFGKCEGTSDVSKDYMRNQYGKCTICSKYYASWKYTDKKEKICLFCDRHQKDINAGKQAAEIEFQKNWLAVPKSIPVPAEPSNIFQITHVEKRVSVFGVSEYLYTRDIEGAVHWFDSRDFRKIADDDRECDNAYAWIVATQIAGPMLKQVGEEEMDEAA